MWSNVCLKKVRRMLWTFFNITQSVENAVTPVVTHLQGRSASSLLIIFGCELWPPGTSAGQSADQKPQPGNSAWRQVWLMSTCGMDWCACTLYILNQESLLNGCPFSSTDVWLKYGFAWQVPAAEWIHFLMLLLLHNLITEASWDLKIVCFDALSQFVGVEDGSLCNDWYRSVQSWSFPDLNINAVSFESFYAWEVTFKGPTDWRGL